MLLASARPARYARQVFGADLAAFDGHGRCWRLYGRSLAFLTGI